MSKTICLLPGDGIGPEIIAQGKLVLEAVAKKFACDFIFEVGLIGGAAVDAGEPPLPDATATLCLRSDAVYLGAVGGPKWDRLEPEKRAERGLLAIRKVLGVFANLRPARLFPELAGACLLRADIAKKGLDLIIVRELIGDIYFGVPRGMEKRNGKRIGFNTISYDEDEIRRIARMAFKIAMGRKKRVCSVEKSNVLETSRVWRDVATETAMEFPEISLEHMYVDNAAMQLVRDPSRFDVILTGNLFGDILSDESAAITGSLGMLPSASLGENGPGLFEPIHGSAPDIAGKDAANPLGTILSGAMLLRLGLEMPDAADCVERAVQETLKAGYRTADIMEEGRIPVSCSRMGQEVAARI